MPISAPDGPITFQASLRVAQNDSSRDDSADSSSAVSSIGKAAGRSARSASDDKKPQDGPIQDPPYQDALNLLPQAPAQQQPSWSAESAGLTSAPVSTLAARDSQVAQSPVPALHATVEQSTLPLAIPSRVPDGLSAAKSFNPGGTVTARVDSSERAPVAVAAPVSSGRQGKDATPAVSRATGTDTTLAPTTVTVAEISLPLATPDVPIAGLTSVPTNTVASTPAPVASVTTKALNSGNQASAGLASSSFATQVQPGKVQQWTRPAVPSDDSWDSVNASGNQAPEKSTLAGAAVVPITVKTVLAFDPASSSTAGSVSPLPTSFPQVQAAPHSTAIDKDAGPQPLPTAPSTDASPVPPSADVSTTVLRSFVPPIQPGLPPIAAQKISNVALSAKGSVTPQSAVHGQASAASTGDDSAKQSVHATSGAPSAQADSQGDTQQTSQAQASPVQHAQTATTAPASDASQPGIVGNHAQPSTPIATTQPSPILEGATAHAANPAAANLPVATLPPHQAPEINTAKLIQSVGQSEMRVGLRSSEFGDISIHTTTARDIVSAQISLDHDELAKTLVSHLPELQAKLGGGQPFAVRIDMNGQAPGQQTGQQMNQGTAGDPGNSGAGNSSSGQSPRAQSVSTAATNESRPAAERLHVASNSTNQRLDITV